MFGAVVACAIVSYLIDGYEDMGLAEFRIAVAMGCLLGVMEVATRFARSQEATPEPNLELDMLTLVSIPVSASRELPAEEADGDSAHTEVSNPSPAVSTQLCQSAVAISSGPSSGVRRR